MCCKLNVLHTRSAIVPFPDPGAPRIMVRNVDAADIVGSARSKISPNTPRRNRLKPKEVIGFWNGGNNWSGW